MSTPYPPPVDRLLTLGEGAANTHPWPDYREMGLTEEHVPELVRMATDEGLNDAPGDTPEVWAPLHAWRTLGQLRAEAAVEPLLSLLHESEDDDDWARGELPVVLGMIGRAAVPALSAYLADPAHPLWTRIGAADALHSIAEEDETVREEVVGILRGQLEKWWRHDEVLNAFLISGLVDLGVTEAAPLMEQAFEAGRVDLMMRGDWENVQVDLGLLPARRTPRPEPDFHPKLPHLHRLRPESSAAPRRNDRQKAKKAKRKLARESRKRNRRRK